MARAASSGLRLICRGSLVHSERTTAPVLPPEPFFLASSWEDKFLGRQVLGKTSSWEDRRRSADHFVLLEPGLHRVPAVFRRFLAVAGAVVGMEAVRGGRIDLELGGLARLGERFLQRFDRGNRNAGIG